MTEIPTAPPAIDRAAVTPSVDDVALLLRTRTVGGQAQGGLGSDTGPADLTTFDDTTRPKGEEVARIIEAATDETLAQLPARVDAQYLPGILRTIALRAASVVELSFFRETSGDSETAASLTGAYLGDLRALQQAIPGEVAIAYGLSEREQALLAPPVDGV